jgi:outer membrane protein
MGLNVLTSRKRTFRMGLRSGVSALAMLAAIGLSVPVAQAETLAEALSLTYETNPDIAAARASLRGTDESVPQALSNWRPEVSVTGSYGIRQRDREFDSNAPDIKNTDQPQTVSLSITQNLFRGFRTIAETDQARNQVAAGRADLITREQDVLLQAVTAFMNVKRDRAILELRQNNVRVLQQQQSATRDRFEVGELTRTDTAQADSRLATAIADETTARGNLDTSIADYVEVVGRVPGVLEAPEVPGGLPATEDEAIELARTNNPSVVSSDFTERAARDSIDLTAGELLPALSINGEAEENKDVLGSDTHTSERSVTLNLSVPLYQSGEVYSRIREAKHLANQRLLEFSEEARQAQEQARSSWAALQSARARITSLQASVDAQQIAFEGVRQEAQVGSRTVLDVLDAEQELLNARVSLVQAQRDLIVTSYQLLSATGRLTALDLGLSVDLYDPTRNFDEVEDQLFGGGILYDRK